MSWSIILLCLFVFCLFYYFYGKVKLWNENRLKIKSTPGVPVELMICNGWLYRLIGNVDTVVCSPEELFRRMRKFADYGATLTFWLVFVPVTYTHLPENVEKIISTMKHTSKGFAYDPLYEWLRTGLLTSSGAKWQTRRKILTPSFHFNILQSFLPVFTKETAKLVEKLEPECGNESTNIIPFITKCTLNSICETAMGTTLKYDKTDRYYVDAVYKMTHFVIYRLSHPWLLPWFIFMFTPSFFIQKYASKILHGFSARVIAERKKNFDPTKFEHLDDENFSYSEKKRLAMLDMLLYAQKQGADIDDDGIREEVDTFMFEGHDTTSTSINFTLMLLACNKDCQDKLYEELYTVFGDSDRDPTYQDLQELKYTERCIKESLRLYPSVPIITRNLDEDIITQEGYTLPKGMCIGIGIYDLHRLKNIYPDPEKFDPDRFLPENIAKRHPYAYIPFSAGPRNCIGQKFAMMELKTVISGILRNFILEPVDTPDSLVLLTDAILRTKDDNIRVRIKRRKCFQ